MAVKHEKEDFKKPEGLICLGRKNYRPNGMPTPVCEELRASTSCNMDAFNPIQCRCVYCHPHKAACR